MCARENSSMLIIFICMCTILCMLTLDLALLFHSLSLSPSLSLSHWQSSVVTLSLSHWQSPVVCRYLLLLTHQIALRDFKERENMWKRKIKAIQWSNNNNRHTSSAITDRSCSTKWKKTHNINIKRLYGSLFHHFYLYFLSFKPQKKVTILHRN